MLIEINGVDGQYVSINPEHVVNAYTHDATGKGWTTCVAVGKAAHAFGPFEDKADADEIVRRVTEAANEVQTAERESEFVEFVNSDGMRTAVNRAMVTSVHVLPGASEQRDPAWQVRIGLCADQSVRTPFTTDRAEADELFDRLTR